MWLWMFLSLWLWLCLWLWPWLLNWLWLWLLAVHNVFQCGCCPTYAVAPVPINCTAQGYDLTQSPSTLLFPPARLIRLSADQISPALRCFRGTAACCRPTPDGGDYYYYLLVLLLLLQLLLLWLWLVHANNPMLHILRVSILQLLYCSADDHSLQDVPYLMSGYVY